MVKSRRGRGGGRRNFSGGSNPYKDRKQGYSHDKVMSADSGNFSEQRARFDGRNSGARGGNWSETGGYNQRQDWTRNHNHVNDQLERNRFSIDLHAKNDSQESGFKKFRDPKALNSGDSFGYNRNFELHNYNSSKTWFKDSRGDYSNTEEHPQSQMETPPDPPESNPPSEATVASAAALESLSQPKEPSVSKEPKLLRKIKTEKIQPENPSPKPKSAKSDKPPPPDSSSSSDSSSEEEETQPPFKKENKEKSKPVPNIHIKKEHVPAIEKKKVVKEAPAAPAPSAEKTDSSSSETSTSYSSSSEDEEIPNMPRPLKSTTPVKPKKERTSEDDVVCLGKMNNIENLVDDDKSQSTACVVCNKQGHPAYECKMKCKKCSHCTYECQMVCKNCGETYGQSQKSMPKPPNPFVMFMQFMQLCMSQYSEVSSDIKYPFPQFESASAPVQGPEPTMEVTRKDIVNSKRERKKSKSDSKQSRKRDRASMHSDMNTQSDSESSSKATTSTKKRKKHAKTAARELETPKMTRPQQQQHVSSFGAHFPANMPFAGPFSLPGYNPMLAFNQMMGFNPATMNFTR